MLSKAFKASELDLNINLPIKISAADFSAGLTKVCFILGILGFEVYKIFGWEGGLRTTKKLRVSRPVKPTNRLKCGIRQGLFLNDGLSMAGIKNFRWKMVKR